MEPPNRKGITRLEGDVVAPAQKSHANGRGLRRWWSKTAGICWSETRGTTNIPCFDYTNEGSFNDHKVVLVFAGGKPRINDRELESFRWWDGRERLPPYPHVTSIVSRYEAS